MVVTTQVVAALKVEEMKKMERRFKLSLTASTIFRILFVTNEVKVIGFI